MQPTDDPLYAKALEKDICDFDLVKEREILKLIALESCDCIGMKKKLYSFSGKAVAGRYGIRKIKDIYWIQYSIGYMIVNQSKKSGMQ